MSKHDPINPSHYQSHPSGVECITITEHLGFLDGNAVKYIWRAPNRPLEQRLTDLKKARWYVDREIARLERPVAKTPEMKPTSGEYAAERRAATEVVFTENPKVVQPKIFLWWFDIWILRTLRERAFSLSIGELATALNGAASESVAHRLNVLRERGLVGCSAAGWTLTSLGRIALADHAGYADYPDPIDRTPEDP